MAKYCIKLQYLTKLFKEYYVRHSNLKFRVFLNDSYVFISLYFIGISDLNGINIMKRARTLIRVWHRGKRKENYIRGLF
jgi:hypothetical protein